MTIRFSFYYDKIFYFITINDVNKLYLNISKTIHFVNTKSKLVSENTNKKNIIPYDKSKSRNKAKEAIELKLNGEKKKSSKNIQFTSLVKKNYLVETDKDDKNLINSIEKKLIKINLLLL